jgi:CHASE2 domain-containing sensor protein
LAITLCVIALFFADERGLNVPLLGQIELKTYDMRLRALPSQPPRYVTIAAIDEQSLARLGRWPWSRTTFAALAERLDQLGARVIAFDLFFPERESPRADATWVPPPWPPPGWRSRRRPSPRWAPAAMPRRPFR